MKKLLTAFFAFILLTPARAQVFSVVLPDSMGKKSLDGRLLLILSNNDRAEPRFQVNGGPSTQLIFGVDIENWKPGTAKTIPVSATGYPIESLKDVPAGEYYIQAVLHIYETFHRKDGHILKLPMDRGEGQHWNLAPGNFYSTPQKIKFNPHTANIRPIVLDKIIPAIKEPEDTRYVKHIKIQSKLLSEFWGRPIYLGAHILLPEGWDAHPDVKYPLAIFHGHFPSDFGDWRTTPADENLKPDTSDRFHITGYNKITQEENYNFYKQLRD